MRGDILLFMRLCRHIHYSSVVNNVLHRVKALLKQVKQTPGASVQSNTGSRAVRISGSNVGYTKFRDSEEYWLPTPFVSFPFTSPSRASPCAITFQLESTCRTP